MDVKTASLNGELEEEAPKQWHQKFDEVVLSSGYLLNQADKCVYSKFDKSGKGVIICLYVDDMLIFGIDQVQSYYIEKVLKKLSYFDCTPVSTPMDTNEKLMPNNGQAVSQLKHSRRVMKYLKKTMDYSLTYTSYSSVLDTLMQAGSAILKTIRLVFLLGGAAVKETEWLRNLILEIPLRSKPIAPIFIRCDSAATLAKAYSQMYNGKSRHLGVRHSMIR
ncbi:zinc finger, CCHC-type containing protein [Tanacetum coccineum]